MSEMKIVVNKCHGGFSLSEAAIYRYAELKGLTLYPDENSIVSSLTTYWTVPPEERPKEILPDGAWHEASREERQASNEAYGRVVLYDRDIPRNDPALIQVVEEMGAKADGRCASLEITEIPDDVQWTIEEYDGLEWVAEVHRTW